MASSLPRLTEAAVQRYIPDPYFERGRNYYRSGRIFDTVRRGDSLEGYCEGSEPKPYRVRVTLAEGGDIGGDDCSCPMGGGCKHVVALLLAWVHESKKFSKREPVEAALERKNKDELIALVREMLKRAPELERLLDLPVPGKTGKSGKRKTRVDPETYRRQIRYAMQEGGDWYAIPQAAREIASVVDIGDGFAEQTNWESAQTVYQAVLDEALPEYLSTHDEGDIGGEIGRAVEGLGECLAARAEDVVARRALLRALFEVLEWDIEAGGLGMSDAVPGLLREHATPEDRREIRQWINAATKKITGDTWSQNYHREVWGRLLMSFTDDVEDFLRQAAKQGLHRPLFEKLVELGRLDEALSVAQKHLASSGWEILQASKALDAAGHAEAAIAFAKAGLPGNKDDRLPAWLAGQYEKRKDLAGALEIHLLRWQMMPTLEIYQSIERLAKKLKQWETLRPRLITALEGDRKFALLADIYLHEEDWDAAWDAAEKDKSPWGNSRLKVAQATEKHRPEKAIPVYLDAAEQLIKQQGRKNYASAAHYLRHVRDLFTATKRSAEWQQTIAALRERHRNLPALQDELRKAKL